MGGEKKSGKGNKKIGRWKRKPSNAGVPRRRVANKAKRVLQSYGPVFAEAWATKNSFTERMLKMIRRREARHASD